MEQASYLGLELGLHRTPELPKEDADGRLRDSLGNHAAAFLGGANEPDKGERGGSCNVTSCQRPGAYWVAPVIGSPYYCMACAHRLNRTNTGKPGWKDLKREP